MDSTSNVVQMPASVGASVIDFEDLLVKKLRSRLTASPQLREMLRRECVDWSDPNLLWDENWYIPKAFIENDQIFCECGERPLYHPRSEMLWCPNCQVVLPPSAFEKPFVPYNKWPCSCNKKDCGKMHLHRKTETQSQVPTAKSEELLKMA